MGLKPPTNREMVRAHEGIYVLFFMLFSFPPLTKKKNKGEREREREREKGGTLFLGHRTRGYEEVLRNSDDVY